MSLPKIATKKQREGYKYALKHPYSLIAMDPRMGKSMVAICLQKARRVNCVIICPSYLIPNWKKEIEKWHPKAMVTMFRKGKDIYDVFDTDFVITSFELAKKSPHLFFWAEMVVIDEIHNLKSMVAKRTEYIHQQVYENSIPYVHGLTGTPLKNRVKEFFSLMALMYYNPKFGPEKKFLKRYPDEITFAEKFSFRESFDVKVVSKKGATFYMPVVKYTGLRNVKKLKKYLKGIYIRIRADEKDLPPITYNDILIKDTADKKLLAAFEKWAEIEGNDSVAPNVKVEAALKKTKFTIKYVENLLDGGTKCVLIYSDHTEPIKKIAEHFKVKAITGAMNGKKRNQMVKDFQDGKTKILCATIGSLKEGADLYRACDLVLNDFCWVYSDLVQVMNRMRKIGKKEPCTVHRIFGSPQDEKIYNTLMEKNKVVEAAT